MNAGLLSVATTFPLDMPAAEPHIHAMAASPASFVCRAPRLIGRNTCDDRASLQDTHSRHAPPLHEAMRLRGKAIFQYIQSKRASCRISHGS